MSKLTLRWQHLSPTDLTQWYGYVKLLPDHALGQWHCFDRKTGEKLWKKQFFRANTICDVASGVIVATEIRTGCPWTCEFGCYGISLEDGQLLWTSHRQGIWGKLFQLLDYIPGYTNGFRDAPTCIENDEVVCQSGRVLEVKTGKLLRKLSAGQIRDNTHDRSLAEKFFWKMHSRNAGSLPLENGLRLVIPKSDKEQFQRKFDIHAEDQQGNIVWRLSFPQINRFLAGDHHSYRLIPPWFYFLVSEAPSFLPTEKKGLLVEPNPTRWCLLVIDIQNGAVIQEISMGEEKAVKCRIEDADEQGILISRSQREFFYFEHDIHP